MDDPLAEHSPKKRISRTRGAAAAPADALPVPADPLAQSGTPAAAQQPARAQEPMLAKPPAAHEPAASAPLAHAVRRAGNDPKLAPEPAEATSARFAKRSLLQAAALLVAVGAGWLGAQALVITRTDAQAAGAPWAEAAQSLRQNQQDVLRLNGDIKTLTVAIASLKESVDRSRADLVAKQAQIAERIEAGAKDPAARLASLNERFDRLERQMTTLQTAVAAKPTPPAPESLTQTGSLEAKPAVKEPPKDVQIEGWVLHEVYDGVALIEGRNRRLFEVGPGGMVPGVGPVVSIERRGRRWVVVTQKGFIGMDR